MLFLPRVLFALILFSAFASTQTFQIHSYNSPDTPRDVFVADLNGDGHADILTANYYGEYVRYFLSRSDGTFPLDGSGTLAISRYALQVNAADYNGDGKMDVAVLGDAMGDPPAYVYVFTGRGDGWFDGPVVNEFMFAPTSMGAMKANGSSRMNLVFTLADPYIKIVYNVGGGKFVDGPTIPSPTGMRVYGVSAGDFNRDGLWDIAALVDNGVEEQSLVYLFRNNGNGTFTPKPIAAVYGTAFATSSVDLNDDGAADLLVTFDHKGSRGGVLAILNNGDATSWSYRTMTVPSTYHVGWKAAQRDLNGDGLHDIVLPVSNTQGKDAVVVFPATSKTTWGAARYYWLDVAENPQAVAIGDFDADRRMDLAVVGANSGELETFLNRTGCVPPVTSPAVNICSPKAGTSVSSPVSIKATARWDGATITHIRAYVDSVGRCDTSSTTILTCSLALTQGAHRLTVNVWNSRGEVIQGSETFSVP